MPKHSNFQNKQLGLTRSLVIQVLVEYVRPKRSNCVIYHLLTELLCSSLAVWRQCKWRKRCWKS